MGVSQHMLYHRGSERRSVLVCSSIHNQQIERLWREIHRCVTGLFYKLFYFLEHNNMGSCVCTKLCVFATNQQSSAVISGLLEQSPYPYRERDDTSPAIYRWSS